MEWFVLIRSMRGASPTLCVLYGTQEQVEERAKTALRWGDLIDGKGPSNRGNHKQVQQYA